MAMISNTETTALLIPVRVQQVNGTSSCFTVTVIIKATGIVAILMGGCGDIVSRCVGLHNRKTKDGRNVEDGKENRQDKKTEQIKNKDYGNRET